MNIENVKLAIKKILNDPSTLEKFKNSEKFKEKFEIAASLDSEFSPEDFESYILAVVNYVKKQIDAGTLSSEEKNILTGNFTNVNQNDKKILALCVMSVFLDDATITEIFGINDKNKKNEIRPLTPQELAQRRRIRKFLKVHNLDKYSKPSNLK